MILEDIIYKKYENQFNGFYVDIGANDGRTQSNTFLLETKNNWSGLLIEPSIKWKDTLCSIRPNSIIENCAITNYNGKILGDFDGSLMSSVNGERLYNDILINGGIKKNINTVEVDCYTLTELCKKHNIKNIDLCSIDVEGHEYQTLEGIDFNYLNIKCFVIEVYNHEEEKIFNLFKSKNYNIECISNFNKIKNPNWDGLHQDYFFSKKDNL